MPDVDLNGNSQTCGLVELSSKVEYALLALLELASLSSQKPLTIGEIAARQPIPERYLEQIFTSLKRGGIVQSQRGARGGYVLLRKPWEVTLLEVVTLVEGKRKSKILSSSPTTEWELVREVWHQSSQVFETALSQCTLHDLCQKREAQRQQHPMYYI